MYKKTKSELKQEEALRLVKQSAKVFGWNVDKAFYDLMGPIFKQYIKDSEKIIDWSYHSMNFFEKKYCNRCDLKQIETKLYKKIKEKCKAKYKAKLLEVYDLFEDVKIEDTPKWHKKWNMITPLEVKHEWVELPETHEKYGKLYQMKTKAGYEENQIHNHKIRAHNYKQECKCYKWRKKQLKWFFENLNHFWW